MAAAILACVSVTSLLALLWVQPASTAPTTEELTRVFDSAGGVYDIAILIEEYRTEHRNLPKATNTRELSQARFKNDVLVEFANDGWKTPLHIDSTPGKGYLVVAAGADRKFDRTSWSRREETQSAADDIVLRDGVLVRSPVAWATAVAAAMGGLDTGAKEALARSHHVRTVANLRSIASAVITFQAVRGQLPAAKTIHALAKVIGSTIPPTDGWERPFHVDVGGRQWLVVSAGADGTLDAKSWTDRAIASDDIVMRDGEIVRNETLPIESAAGKLADSIAGYKALRARFEAMRR